MSKVVITISTDNDAFSEYPVIEVSRILRQYSNHIGSTEVIDNTKLYDINGNVVGEVQVYADDKA